MAHKIFSISVALFALLQFFLPQLASCSKRLDAPKGYEFTNFKEASSRLANCLGSISAGSTANNLMELLTTSDAYRFITKHLPSVRSSKGPGGPQTRSNVEGQLLLLALGSDVLQKHFLERLDIISLFTLPLVCKAWKEALEPKIKIRDADCQDLYLQEVSRVRKIYIRKTEIYKDYFQGKKDNVDNYLSWCIVNGALSRAVQEYHLQSEVSAYLTCLIAGTISLPKLKSSISQYDLFVKLFGQIYGFCTDYKPILRKPVFLSDKEYEQAVSHFVCEEGWAPKLSESLVDDMPRLFNIIGKNEKRMKELLQRNIGEPVKVSIDLIVCGQTSVIQEELAKLVFSQTDLFKGLVEPQPIPFHEYYNVILESNVIPEVIMDGYKARQFCKFLASFILSFKKDTGKIDKIVKAITSKFPRAFHEKLRDRMQFLGWEPFIFRMDREGHSTEDANFFREVMEKCRLL